MTKVIYEPSGKAREYCNLALNLYTGCEHACTYCYCIYVLKKNREDFNNNIFPRKNILENILKEIGQYKNKEILMCFTCDPYQPQEEKYKITQQTLELFKLAKAIPNILTKSKLVQRDFELLRSCNNAKLGMTLTVIDDNLSRHFEPKASLFIERFETLKKAKDIGLDTWVSLEPVLIPEQTIEIIKLTYTFINKFKVGKANYCAESKSIDWKKFYYDVTNLLTKLNCKFYIKEDLKKYA